MRLPIPVILCGILLAVPFSAQHEHAHSPYAGEEASDIPSLRAEELAGLRNGDGMGFARAAELNHYPGPKHVLELAELLELSEAQRQRVEEIRSKMSNEAVRVGAMIIEEERALNRRFAHEHIDETTLRELTTDIARLQGELRHAHLVAHLSTRATLSAKQIAAYDRLRGYGEQPSHP